MPSRLSLLGGVVIDDHVTERPLPLDRRGALLAYLAYDGGWVDRDRLVVLFWPDSDEAGAKRNLRQLLHRTRRLDLDPPVEVTARSLRWRVDTDVKAFRAALAAGDHAAAVGLYRGDLLEGLAPEDGRGFEAWLEAERAGLQAAFHTAGLREAEAATAEGRFDDAVQVLARLRTGDPLAEDVVEATMRALYLSGRRDAALALYTSFASELASELGLEPLPSTSELLERISANQPVGVEPRRRESEPRVRTELQPTALIGRDAARAALLTATTPAVMVTAEPGMGKSALLSELYEGSLRTGAREGLELMPYHPVAALLRARQDLVALAGAHRDDLARLVPELAPDVTPAPLDPDTAKLRLADALLAVVRSAGGVLVVDDLQWADAATLECLVYLVSRGVTVVGAYRPGEVGRGLASVLAGLRARGELTEVSLEPLSERGVASIMADLMGAEQGPELFSRRLWQRTGGNPLFILETLRSLMEAGTLRADDSGWHTDIDEITVDYSELDVPHRVTEVIGRRLDQLDETAVRVLEVMALSPVPLSALQSSKVTGLSLAATLTALDLSDAAGFTAAGRFRHDLLRETTVARVSSNRAAVTRGLLARELSEGPAGAADPGVIAELWWQAGEHGAARSQWLAMATQMRTRGLHVAALEVLADAIGRLPDGVDRKWLRLAVAEVTLEGGWHDRMPDLLADLHLDPSDPPELHAKLALTTAIWLLNGGSFTEADAALAAQRHWFALTDDEALAMELSMFDARIATQRGDLDAAIGLIEPIVHRLRARRPGPKRVLFVSSLAALYDNMGRHEEALGLHHEALTAARSMGSRYLAAEASINLLYCMSDLGRHDEAIAFGEAALKETTYDNEPIVRINLAANYRYAGRWAEAIEHYRVIAGQELPHLRVIALARWAEAAARSGDDAEVHRLIDLLLRSLDSTDFPVALATAAVVLYSIGTTGQVQEFERIVPALDPELLPPFLRDELTAALLKQRTDGGV